MAKSNGTTILKRFCVPQAEKTSLQSSFSQTVRSNKKDSLKTLTICLTLAKFPTFLPLMKRQTSWNSSEQTLELMESPQKELLINFMPSLLNEAKLIFILCSLSPLLETPLETESECSLVWLIVAQLIGFSNGLRTHWFPWPKSSLKKSKWSPKSKDLAQ